MADLVGAFFFKMVGSSLPASSAARVPRERVPVPSPSTLVAPAGVAPPRSVSWEVRGVGAESVVGSPGFFQADLPLVAGAVAGAGDGEHPLRQPLLEAREVPPHGPHEADNATGWQP